MPKAPKEDHSKTQVESKTPQQAKNPLDNLSTGEILNYVAKFRREIHPQLEPLAEPLGPKPPPPQVQAETGPSSSKTVPISRRTPYEEQLRNRDRSKSKEKSKTLAEELAALIEKYQVQPTDPSKKKEALRLLARIADDTKRVIDIIENL